MLSYQVRLAAIALLSAGLGLAQNPATTVNVDANANRHAINPNIYGIAYGDAHDMTTLNAPLNRWGGNSTSRYNWQIDAHSAASDWYFETYSDGSGTPSESADAFVASTRANNGAEPLFTIPMIDYLANLGPNRSTLEGFSVKKYGAQQSTDPWNSDAGNGVSSSTGKNITGNNPLDTGVANSTTIQQGWLQHFVSTFGAASTSTGIKYYVLDNEPSLWNSTHRDVHPNPSTYQEMYNKIVAYAGAIRAVDPAAKIVGPEEWSWWAMFFSGLDQANGWSAANSDYNTHNQTYYYPWLLQQLYAYKQQTGTQLIDVLTVHCYNGAPDGGDDSLAGQQYRNRETRILWDPNFQDPSWYGDIGINGRVINWIPTMKAMVSQYHPGLEIGCTEYNWGDEANLNGATTQADVLGIYGREGFDLATRWTVAKNTNTNPTTYYVTYLASQIYRNYDGGGSTFGETSVQAGVANPDNLSAFASVRDSDGALTVMVINKQQGSTPVTVSLANFSTGAKAQAWQINSAAQTSIARLADVDVANNSVSATVPSQSITLFVIPSGGTVSAPSAPTGLAATVGNGTVNLTWNGAGGATSYTVKRGIASGGPYATVGTVGSSPTSFTDSGLTNGTTYYYVVTGTNSAGTSPNSAELPATPVVPPTFTSSATATPNPVNQGVSTVYQRDRQRHGEYVDEWGGANRGAGPERRHRADAELHRAGLYDRSNAIVSGLVSYHRWRDVHGGDWRVQCDQSAMELERVGGNDHGELESDVYIVRQSGSIDVRAGRFHYHCRFRHRHRHQRACQFDCRIAGFRQIGECGDDHLLDRPELRGGPDTAVFLHLGLAGEPCSLAPTRWTLACSMPLGRTIITGTGRLVRSRFRTHSRLPRPRD